MDGLNTKFSALADPTRRAILARLSLGEATVNELASPFEMTQPAISQHLKVLEDAGLIMRRVEGTALRLRRTTTGWTKFWPASTHRRKEKRDEQDDVEDGRR